MFKNATVYRIETGLITDLVKIKEALANGHFTPCGPTALKSTGWSEPRCVEHGELIESIGGQWILKLMTEKKNLPPSVVEQALQERLKKIEEQTGRKPGKKEKREIKEEIILSLLPQAFAKRSAVTIWMDRQAGLLVVGSTSGATTDSVITHLIRVIDGLKVWPINTTHSPAGSMSSWLKAKEIDENFDFGGECELEAIDESKAAVKYARHRLDIDEIEQHISRDGKTPKSLALVWSGRVSFVLNKTLHIKKIKIMDLDVSESPDSSGGGDVDSFDANVAIFTGELSRLLPDLIGSMGGEIAHAGADAL